VRILLAEDEKSLNRAIVAILEKNHYSVDSVYNGLDAFDYLEAGNYDGVILDIMMPKMDGITVLKKIREKGISVPVLILSAKSEVDDKVFGLDSGANDYLTKPFETPELLARIRAMTRQQTIAVTNELSFGNVKLNQTSFNLSTSDGNFQLANKEYQIMEMLLSNPMQLIPTERFLEKIWGFDSDAEINVVWVYISYLRKKLTAINADIQIKATRNTGYTLEKIS